MDAIIEKLLHALPGECASLILILVIACGVLWRRYQKTLEMLILSKEGLEQLKTLVRNAKNKTLDNN